MKRLLIATHNPGKLAEFRGVLQPLGFDVVGAEAMGLSEPEETGATFAQNARIKALAAANGVMALADDSGLCVAALAGGPGVLSARYAAGDYPAAFARILAACQAAADRRAKFVCALCLARPDGATATFIGQAEGRIANAPAGATGFGYDPIFIPEGFHTTYAELGAQKSNMSHRARAVAQLLAHLR